MNNALLEKSTLDHGALEFNKYKTEDFLPALKESISIAKKRLEGIKNEANPTFENIIVALERIDGELNQVASVFYNLMSAEKTDAIQAISEDFSRQITEYSNDISLDSKLFEQVEKVWQKRNDFSGEEAMLLEKTYKGFVRGGAKLNPTDKEKLRSLDTELADIKLKFSNNILKATNAFELLITNEADLDGIPESFLEAAMEAAKEKDKEGWLFTLHYPSFMPFMTYAKNRELRKQMFMAFSTRAYGGEFDNTNLSKRIATLSYERAKLLGYKDHAHYVLEERMAGNKDKVTSFLDELLAKATPAANSEMADLQKWVSEQGGPAQLESWDYAFWADKLKKARFNVDDEQLRPYFKL